MLQNTPLPTVPQRRSARSVLQAAPQARARSLYVHVPFCFHKCHYCDFYSLVDTRDRQEPFAGRLIRELAAISPWAGPLSTIFVGGGTPSLLRPDLWRRVLAALGDHFDLAEIKAGRGEFTVECNPETVTPELMGVLRSGGVDRISIGAQSFEPRHLKTLERWHDPESVPRAVEMAREAGFSRLSLDLIYAIPGQTIAEWERDLERALALGTEHLSCYNLTYEPGTAMTARLKRGEFEPVDEEGEIGMFEAAERMARKAGLERYEISNFARPGCESRHNLVYWRCGEWLAAGPSAAGHVAAESGGHRWKHSPRLDDYLSIEDGGFAPIAEHEPPDAPRLVRERIMMGIRLSEGLDADALVRQAAAVSAAWGGSLASAIESSVAGGLAERIGEHVRLTDRGVLLADRIASEWMRSGDVNGCPLRAD